MKLLRKLKVLTALTQTCNFSSMSSSLSSKSSWSSLHSYSTWTWELNLPDNAWVSWKEYRAVRNTYACTTAGRHVGGRREEHWLWVKHLVFRASGSTPSSNLLTCLKCWVKTVKCYIKHRQGKFYLEWVIPRNARVLSLVTLREPYREAGNRTKVGHMQGKHPYYYCVIPLAPAGNIWPRRRNASFLDHERMEVCLQ